MILRLQILLFLILLVLNSSDNADGSSNSKLKRQKRFPVPATITHSIVGGIGLFTDLVAISTYIMDKLKGESGEDDLKATLHHLTTHLDIVEGQLKSSMDLIRSLIEVDAANTALSVNYQPIIPMNLIQFEGMKTRFFASEQTIRNCYEYWRAFLTTKTVQAKEEFINQSSELIKSLNVLMDGLLGAGIFGSDLLVVTQLAHNSHPRSFRRDADTYLELVGIGVGVLTAYHYYSDTLEVNQNYWRAQLAGKEVAVRSRIRNIEADCRDESRIPEEIERVLLTQPAGEIDWTSNHIAANRLLAFLTDKYDTRSWFVLIHDLPPDIQIGPGLIHPYAASFTAYYHQRVICITDQIKRNVLVASLGPEDYWNADELASIRQLVDDYCSTGAFTNNRQVSRFKSPAGGPGELMPRCHHYRADVVLEQLTSLLPNGRVAVWLTGSRPANALALHQSAPFEPVYLSFGHHKSGLQVLVLPTGRESLP